MESIESQSSVEYRNIFFEFLFMFQGVNEVKNFVPILLISVVFVHNFRIFALFHQFRF